MLKSSGPIVKKPETVSDDKPYVIDISFSSPEEDLHHTRMGQSSLDNFLRQVNDNQVAMCPNHVKECPIGKAYDAKRGDNGILLCKAEFDRDLPLIHPEAGFANSNMIIRQIDAERIRKTSIGGYGGELHCNIDGRDMLVDWGCYHWPGVTYKVKVKESDDSDKLVEQEIRCIPSWEKLSLGEISSVWAGSNLQSEILKQRAISMLDAGALDKTTTLRLNRMFNYSLDISRAKDDGKTIFDLGVNSNKEGDKEMSLTEEQIAELQAQKKAAEEKAERLEREKLELADDAAALGVEKSDVKSDCLKAYKEFRGDNLTGKDLVEYEKTLDGMSLGEMKVQRSILGIEKSEEGTDGAGNSGGTVKSGRATGDKNKETSDDENADYKHPHGASIPTWFKAKNVTGAI